MTKKQNEKVDNIEVPINLSNAELKAKIEEFEKKGKKDVPANSKKG
jgi:hypothetical protein